MSELRSNEQKFIKAEDFEGDGFSAWVCSSEFRVGLSDRAEHVYVGLDDARALRDWLNKVLP